MNEQYHLHWHALNYRTASSQDAQAMFEILEAFVQGMVAHAVKAEEKRAVDECMKVAEQNQVFCSMTAEECANCIQGTPIQENRR